MDVTQIILVSVISLLTLMLLLVGFQVFLLLLDLQKSIKRANRILDEIEVSGKIFKKIFKEKRKVPVKRTSKVKVGVDEFMPLETPRPRFFKGIPKRRQLI